MDDVPLRALDGLFYDDFEVFLGADRGLKPQIGSRTPVPSEEDDDASSSARARSAVTHMRGSIHRCHVARAAT